MEFTASQIADLLGGTVEGNPELTVSNVSKIEEGKPGTLSFLANPKYTAYLYETKASIVIINKDFKLEKAVATTLIRVEDAYSAFAQLLDVYQQYKNNKTGISSLAFISNNSEYGEGLYAGEFAFVGENVKIGANVKLYPQVYIGDDCVIGDESVIYPGVKLYPGTVVGKYCVIHAGAVLGSDGFGFAPQSDSHYKKVPQIGQVILEDYVDIGANTTIDRATLGATIIRKGVKLDNLIQVAHNVEIGENTVIAAQTGISGSTKIGRNCMFGGQVGLAGHLTIADGVKLAAQSGVGTSIRTKDDVFMGSPAIPASEYKKLYMHYRRLERLSKKMEALQQQLDELKG
ncbi:MAG: UDP-3-O-(3-hydroxymyristoyl)glucosamine N-acyltransferase [Bacteroidetes bacterium]|nr:UDP-3-O-(3-hydroxymyristoyl)glucosamine N-acyltransferase [Bacteroidota bacterium]MBU1578874.1 UDP-3-O-(3-hydroxymyristoyl)glucosamine N-acyltransferase [Bacteroidota bacterium]MBU2465818.1 UDP-3-O-(3-hydroxymyristoyl)glucosamine N-acyltransferase [Bacteroidota bacterium]MBU2557825.1 UDP-3-O-(3-hydroxymyristoyl)glucosamine N-acyltransferase [Bacteroidota bacterium]